MSSFNELQKASVSTAFFMVLKLFSEGPHPSGIALGNRNNFPGYALDFDFEKKRSYLPEELSSNKVQSSSILKSLIKASSDHVFFSDSGKRCILLFVIGLISSFRGTFWHNLGQRLG